MVTLRTRKLAISTLYLLLGILFTIVATNAFALQNKDLQKVANAEIIDLSHKDWGEGRVFSLESPWLFAWNTFTHEPKDKPQHTWHTVNVPGSWSDYFEEQATSGMPLPPTGFGTYYKRILVPESTKKAFIYLPDMASAYELWHNGANLGGNGSIGINKEQEKADYLPRVYELKPTNGEIELFIKTSNHHYLWGGIWYAPSITDESGVYKIREIPILKAMSSGAILLATAIFCFFMYLSRKQDKKVLYFSLFCLAIGIRRLSMDERILYMLNLFDWQSLQSIENITLYLMLPLFLSYFHLVFPQTTSKKLPLIGWICIAPFCISASFLEVGIYSGFNPYYQIVVLAFLPFILLSWGQALKAKLKHSRMFGLSLLVFVAAVINDMLNYSYIIRTTNLTHLGVLAFVLFQLASLINRYLSNFRAIETLSETLQEKNTALIQYDEFKDDFLANTSHELRMPLHGMAGLAKTIRKTSPDLPEDSQHKIKLIEATAVRLGNLVNDILDMSSLKHGKLNIEKHSIYIEPIIENTVLSLSPLIKAKPISIEYSIEDNAKVVFADEQRLQQVLYNLIGNAIKFTNEGFIRISTHLENNRVHVHVADSGVGMSEEQLKTALQAYEMHNHQSGNELRSSGLGLSITKMLIELHGGSLRIESKEGAGTTASFSIQTSSEVPHTPNEDTPMLQQAPESEISTNVTSNNSLTQGALIFYADDEEVNRELVSSQLSAAGYHIKTFEDGQALLEQLNIERPELALLDWVMPEKDGLEVCKTIREQHDASDLPIIMLTAKHQIHHIVEALNAGANDYLTKPYHEQELIARVSSQISVKRLLIATIENENLKLEVARQERQKQKLDLANQRLETTIESSQESILLLNEDLDIIYANSSAKKLLGINIDILSSEAFESADTVSDMPIANFVSSDSLLLLKKNVNTEHKDEPFVLELTHDQSEFKANLRITDINEDRFISLIINNKQSGADQKTQELLSNLTQEIAENRQRMEQIESTLLQLNQKEAAETQSELPAPINKQNTLDPKELVVKTLRTSLISWERYTHKSKAELAEESHCWRVYLDGATAKTRTLDKYLSVKTLPAKPRWRAVIKTANYVLDHCDLSNEDQQELNDLVQQLTQAFS